MKMDLGSRGSCSVSSGRLKSTGIWIGGDDFRHFICVPFASGSQFVSASLEEYKKFGLQWETTLGVIPVFSVRGSTVASCSSSVPEALGWLLLDFTHFLREGELEWLFALGNRTFFCVLRF